MTILSIKGGTISINGKTYNVGKGQNVTMINNKIFVNGVPIEKYVETKDEQVVVNITINGDVQELNTVEADYIGEIKVTGSCHKVKTHNGNVSVGGDCETVSTHNGNIICGNVGGDVETHNGNISYRK